MARSSSAWWEAKTRTRLVSLRFAVLAALRVILQQDLELSQATHQNSALVEQIDDYRCPGKIDPKIGLQTNGRLRTPQCTSIEMPFLGAVAFGFQQPPIHHLDEADKICRAQPAELARADANAFIQQLNVDVACRAHVSSPGERCYAHRDIRADVSTRLADRTPSRAASARRSRAPAMIPPTAARSSAPRTHRPAACPA